MRTRTLPTRLAALLAAGLAVGLPDAGAKPPLVLKPAPVSSETTGPVPRQVGLASAPFQLLVLVAEPGSSVPINNLASAGDLLYRGWCDLYSFQAGGDTAVHVSSAGTTVDKPKLDTLGFHRAADETTTTLFSRLVTGKPCDFTFVIVRNAPDRIESWKIKCTGAYVSAQTFSGSDDSFSEGDSITFTTMEWSYSQMDSTGKVNETYANYNVTTNRAAGGVRAPIYPGGQDSNGNGIPDGWETFYGLDVSNPNNGAANAMGDLDGDGQSNLAEYLAGTVPDDPQSVLRMSAVSFTTIAGGPAVRLTWNSVAGKNYQVQSAAAVGGPWAAVDPTGSTIPSSGNGTTTTTVDATGKATFFYRVVVVP